MPAGRPTKYKPEYCQKVIDIGANGGWLSEMAEECDVCRATMDVWAAEHPQFLEALTRAKQKAQAWFEAKGREGMEKPVFNAALWQKQMSARHREDYTERSVNEHTGPNGSDLFKSFLENVGKNGKRLGD